MRWFWRLNPTCPAAISDGMIGLVKGDYDGALADARRAVALAPNAPFPSAFLALSASMRVNWRKQIASSSQACGSIQYSPLGASTTGCYANFG